MNGKVLEAFRQWGYLQADIDPLRLLEPEPHPELDVGGEPANMGALGFVLPRLHQLAGGRPVRSVKRSASASPATGSAKAHEIERNTLIHLAFETGKQSGR